MGQRRVSPSRFVRLVGLAVALACLLLPVCITLVAAQSADAPFVDVLGPTVPLPAKSRVTTFLVVGNEGPGNITNVSAVVRPLIGSELVVIGQLEQFLDDIPRGETGIVALHVATGDRAAGALLGLTVRFQDERGIRHVVDREVSIQIGPPRSDPLIIEYIPEPLTVGQDGTLAFIVRNPSGRTLYDLDIDLVLQETSLSSIIGGGGISSAAVDISAGADGSPLARGEVAAPYSANELFAGVRTSLKANDLLRFTLRARYTLDGFERTQDYDFGARVQGSFVFRVLDAREQPSGDDTRLVATLVNVGTGVARNPRVSVVNGSGYQPTTPVLISDLKPNDPVDVTVVTRIASNQTGAADPLFLIEWNDEFGEIFTTRVGAAVQPAPASGVTAYARVSQALAKPWVVGLGAIAIVALAVGISRLRARHRLDEE